MRSWLTAILTKHKEFLLFVVMGGVNTGLTYAVYLLLLLVMRYPFAYSGSYVAGIFLSYYLNVRFVFRERLSLSKALKYPSVYLIQYLLGLVLLYVLIEIFHLNKNLAPLAIVLITVPATFVMSRYIIRGKPKRV
ncbi:MAG: GtrA family protein [Chthoniobacterales bacterium]